MRYLSNFQGLLTFIISALIVLWFLYLAYRVAVHVSAWPFGQ